MSEYDFMKRLLSSINSTKNGNVLLKINSDELPIVEKLKKEIQKWNVYVWKEGEDKPQTTPPSITFLISPF